MPPECIVLIDRKKKSCKKAGIGKYKGTDKDGTYKECPSDDPDKAPTKKCKNNCEKDITKKKRQCAYTCCRLGINPLP